MKEAKKLNLENRVFPSIKKAVAKYNALACFIFVAADQHANLVSKSLKNNLHTYFVKPVAIDKKEFKKIYSIVKKNLQFLQGYNNQWNEAANHMYKTIYEEKAIGKILGGQCICWEKNLKISPPHIEVKKKGMFYLALACHQFVN